MTFKKGDVVIYYGAVGVVLPPDRYQKPGSLNVDFGLGMNRSCPFDTERIAMLRLYDSNPYDLDPLE